MNISTPVSVLAVVENASKYVPPVNPFLYWTDSYKISHILFETNGVSEIYSNFTARFDKYLQQLLGKHYDRKYVVFGIQWMLLRLHAMAQKGFFDRPKEEVIQEMKDELGPYINQEKYDQFEALHDLGYLPIIVKALDEGTVVPVGLPFFTIRNTHPDFEWLPNFLETGISTDMWKQLTVATVARVYRKISNDFAMKTTGSTDGTEFQNHDFHSRGAAGFESCGAVGAAFLTSSCGTDNLASLWASRYFYGSTNAQGFLAASVPAGEHSVTTSGILTEVERARLHPTKPELISKEEAEFMYAKKLLTERFPTGILSYVADSYDYWTFITVILPRLKDVIMARDGKFVVRGDSGNPVHVIAGYRFTSIGLSTDELIEAGDRGYQELINRKVVKAKEDGFEVVRIAGRYSKICGDEGGIFLVEISEAEALGTIASLHAIFGGTTNAQGFIELDSHIGMIYGDGITVQRSEDILTRLEEKGFASLNIVFGVGSFSLGMLSRDHLGMAIKATNTIVDIHGEKVDTAIYKDPKTDSSKKSAKGLMMITEVDGNLTMKDECTREEEALGLLTTVYENGQFLKLTNIFEIRDRIWK
ncbi:nicotinamide phosphoribosyl transferase [Acinetobacter phage Acj9]|uniref:Nicotinamide phosphoribosyltransferase n=1 Tax=Acinetobacter phage Acj9 TaxID=760939 RepID=E5EPK4_9CAUD|nr:nicotinamide phosphoribosyl transferase [Acinetobacter phage Acj9]ADG59970.1 putative nicotinate phosphoribosyltransferase [Acinetobacter phage Acj9]